MSWLSDATGIDIDVNKAVDRAVGNPVRSVTNPVQRFLDQQKRNIDSARDNYSRSDIGRYTDTFGRDVINIGRAGITTPINILTGNRKGLESDLKRAAGSAASMSGGFVGYGFSTDKGQELLRNKDVTKYSLGYSEDYAGTLRGSNTLARDAEISNQDRDSALRFGSKTAAIGAAAIYGKQAYTWLAEKTTYQNVAATGAAIGAAKKGNYTDVVNQLTGANLPPGIIDRPPVTDIANPGSPAGQIGSTSPGVSDPWRWGGNADSGISPASSSGFGLPIMAIAAIAGIFILRKKGVI